MTASVLAYCVVTDGIKSYKTMPYFGSNPWVSSIGDYHEFLCFCFSALTVCDLRDAMIKYSTEFQFSCMFMRPSCL